MYCSRCEIEYPAGKKFCKNCGATLIERTATPPSTKQPTVQCPSCGNSYPVGKKFCRNCGTALSSTQAAPATAAAETNATTAPPKSDEQTPPPSAASHVTVQQRDVDESKRLVDTSLSQASPPAAPAKQSQPNVSSESKVRIEAPEILTREAKYDPKFTQASASPLSPPVSQAESGSSYDKRKVFIISAIAVVVLGLGISGWFVYQRQATLKAEQERAAAQEKEKQQAEIERLRMEAEKRQKEQEAELERQRTLQERAERDREAAEAELQRQQALRQEAEKRQREQEAELQRQRALQEKAEQDRKAAEAELQRRQALARQSETQNQQVARQVSSQPVPLPRTASPAPRAVPYQGPSYGSLIWKGNVSGEELITIEGDTASSGSLTGSLPGVACIVQPDDPKRVVIASAPGPSNQFKRLVIRVRGKGPTSVRLTWTLP